MKDPITSKLYESPRVSLYQQRKAKETRARAGSIDRGSLLSRNIFWEELIILFQLQLGEIQHRGGHRDHEK